MKKLEYPISKNDFEGLVLGERIKIKCLLGEGKEFELCAVGANDKKLSRDMVVSSSDNGTELRLVR